MIPAILATPSTSPFLSEFDRISCSDVGFEKYTRPTAVAEREVVDLAVMFTMCTSPVGVRCVNLSGLGASEAGWGLGLGGG